MASSWSPVWPSFSTILLWLLLMVFSNCPVSSLETLRVEDEVQKMKMIKEYLQKINKPAEKTIKTIDGDLIDCILFHKQPAFDHPLLKGKIPMEPPEPSIGSNRTGEIIENFQLWNANGEGCPKGTIPIRRTTEEEVLRAISVAKSATKIIPHEKDANSSDGHEYAVGNVGPGQYYGVSARLNLWAPQVSSPLEFSSSQVLVAAGSGLNLNTLEAGWHVFPFFYDDNRPRLFLYFYTTNSSKTRGCYNLRCRGFIQTSHEIVLGGTIGPISSYDGPQFDITVTIKKDPKDGNWWLLYGRGSGTAVGYWPSDFFPLLKESATSLEFGGEVFNSMPSGAHTTTQMGSGHFPGEGFKKAAYVSDLEILGQGLQPIPDFMVNPLVSNSHCYDLLLESPTTMLGTHFFFGGPGKGDGCP